MLGMFSGVIRQTGSLCASTEGRCSSQKRERVCSSVCFTAGYGECYVSKTPKRESWIN